MSLEIYEYLIAFIAASVAGFIDALIGGGGLITAPCILALGVPPQLALATSKLQSAMGAISAVITLKKEFNLKALAMALIITMVFSIFGAMLLLSLDNKFLKPLILILLVLVFLYTVLKPNLGNEHSAKRMNRALFYVLFASVLGFYDGFLGPGTGSFWIFSLVLLQGYSLKEASVETKALNAASNISALIYFMCFFDIFWSLGLIMGLGSILGARLGSAYLLKANLKLIRIVFILIVAASIAKFGYEFAMS